MEPRTARRREKEGSLVMALVKVGIVALRAPDGSFLPAEPIYKELPVNERGRTVQEEKSTEEISKLLAGKFKAYIDGCKAAGLDERKE